MGSWFTRYPGRPDYFTHWGSAFKYAASLLGLPIGEYPHSRPPASGTARRRAGTDPNGLSAPRIDRRIGPSWAVRSVAEGATDRCTVWKSIELYAATEEVRRVSVPDSVAESVTSDTDPVLYEIRATGVALLTLNRPERMNGWGGGLATSF